MTCSYGQPTVLLVVLVEQGMEDEGASVVYRRLLKEFGISTNY